MLYLIFKFCILSVYCRHVYKWSLGFTPPPRNILENCVVYFILPKFFLFIGIQHTFMLKEKYCKTRGSWTGLSVFFYQYYRKMQQWVYDGDGTVYLLNIYQNHVIVKIRFKNVYLVLVGKIKYCPIITSYKLHHYFSSASVSVQIWYKCDIGGSALLLIIYLQNQIFLNERQYNIQLTIFSFRAKNFLKTAENEKESSNIQDMENENDILNYNPRTQSQTNNNIELPKMMLMLVYFY